MLIGLFAPLAVQGVAQAALLQACAKHVASCPAATTWLEQPFLALHFPGHPADFSWYQNCASASAPSCPAHSCPVFPLPPQLCFIFTCKCVSSSPADPVLPELCLSQRLIKQSSTYCPVFRSLHLQILSYQNWDGGWATYENKRSFEALEVRHIVQVQNAVFCATVLDASALTYCPHLESGSAEVIVGKGEGAGPQLAASQCAAMPHATCAPYPTHRIL